MSKMIEELAAAVAHFTDKACKAQAAAEDAHAAAEKAQQLLRAASILDKQAPLHFLDNEVELTCHEPDLTWNGCRAVVEVDVHLDVCGQELVLEKHEVALKNCDLDCLSPDYAVVCFTVLDMVKAIAAVLRDEASCDEETAQNIAAITGELRRLAGL